MVVHSRRADATVSSWRELLRRVTATGLSAVIAALTYLVAAPSLTLAYCNPMRGYDPSAFQAGVVGGGPYPDGVSATTDEYDPYYTGHNSTGSLMSVMLDNGAYWGQLGWLRHGPTGATKREIFVEHVDGFGNNLWFYWADKPVGTTTTYKITFDASNHHFHYLVNGSEYANLGAASTWNPTRFEIFGETHDAEDQMPGGFAAQAKFVGSIYRPHSTGIWVTATGTVHSNGGSYNFATNPSSGKFNVYDTQCAS